MWPFDSSPLGRARRDLKSKARSLAALLLPRTYLEVEDFELRFEDRYHSDPVLEYVILPPNGGPSDGFFREVLLNDAMVLRVLECWPQIMGKAQEIARLREEQEARRLRDLEERARRLGY